ncbi:MAG: hypothetical protein ACYCT1_12990 [Steroidobacteraceae bacterium]
MSKIREHLEEANRHLDAAIQHHDEGSHHAARYRIGQAKKSVTDALGAELASPDAAANPTGAAGAQTSDGHAPRSVEAIAARLFAPGRHR